MLALTLARKTHIHTSHWMKHTSLSLSDISFVDPHLLSFYTHTHIQNSAAFHIKQF